jgi:hypothetical protein
MGAKSLSKIPTILSCGNFNLNFPPSSSSLRSTLDSEKEKSSIMKRNSKKIMESDFEKIQVVLWIFKFGFFIINLF